MECSRCGHDNLEVGQFCGVCGASLSAPTASGLGVGTAELAMVSFLEALKLGYQRYFDFKGRSPRAEFWWWYLFSCIAFMVMFWTCMIVALLVQESLGMFFFMMFIPYPILLLIVGIPHLSLSSRRLHDTGRSGWWYLLNFVPFGSILVIVWWCTRGKAGPNKYGPDPRQPTSQQALIASSLLTC